MYDPVLTVLVLAGAALLIIAAFALSMFLFKRTVLYIIYTFQEHEAVREENAKTLEEMGLRPKTMMESLVNPGLRDYKPQAFYVLMTHNIVKTTPDNRYYLSEYDLMIKIPKFQH